jgi:NADH-quinone oxidoreductase subunit N
MGVAQIYGYVGSLDYAAVSKFLETAGPNVPLMMHVASILVMVAFAYKVGLAPFHMWSPDVYQGGPTALSAYLATATKVALFSSFAVVLYSTGLIKLTYVQQGLYALGLISVIVGSLMALIQSQLKRMLAYSGVANAGYATFALISGTAALGPMFSFLSLYALALIIGFAFAQEATLKEGAQSHADVEITGLDAKAPRLSTASKALFTVAMFSLAGIPPFPGFLAKYQILSQVWSAGFVWGAALILVGSILGIGYYLRTLVPLFMKNLEEGVDAQARFFGAPTFVAAVATVMLLAVLLGFSRVNQWVDYVAFFAR